MKDPTRRFSDRVEDYLRARPFYPHGVLEIARERCGLRPSWLVADVGSGTGNLSRLFLEHGNRVIGVEPNREMREAGDVALSAYEGYRSVDGCAEATGLETDSVDLVTAGQAFHWFDAEASRRELARVLRRGRFSLIVWNDRLERGSGLMEGYEGLLRRYGTDYRQVRDRRSDETQLGAFFGTRAYGSAELPYTQSLDRAGFRARVRSSSYVPASGTAGHDRLMRAVDELFAEHARSGRVELIYRTRLYYGELDR
jgi:SAM-dependent methyltransferase